MVKFLYKKIFLCKNKFLWMDKVDMLGLSNCTGNNRTRYRLVYKGQVCGGQVYPASPYIKIIFYIKIYFYMHIIILICIYGGYLSSKGLYIWTSPLQLLHLHTTEFYCSYSSEFIPFATLILFYFSSLYFYPDFILIFIFYRS